VEATDGAGNVGEGFVNIDVVAGLSDRSAYLGVGFNYIGFPLVPTVEEIETLLEQDITNVNPALKDAMQADQSRNVKLSDVIDIVFAHTGGASGDFVTFTPGAASDTFETLAPFDGMIVSVLPTIEVDGGSFNVFDTGSVLGSVVNVPIKWNVAGVFTLPPPALPPSEELLTGFNLWTPHATNADLFENPGFLRGAVVTPPGNLAVSAISQINRADAVADETEPGGFGIETEQAFSSAGPGDTLELMRSYWTFMVGDATITP
jgi:hypothetical protein